MNHLPLSVDRCRAAPRASGLGVRVSCCLAAVALLAAACSGSAANSSSEVAPRGSVAQQGVTPAPTTVPTSPSAAVAPATGPLDVVGIGDSFIGWSTVVEQFAELLAEERGAAVSVDKIAGQTTNRLDYLRTADSAKALLSEAEIVIVQPQPGPPAAPAFRLHFLGDCGGEDGRDCFRSALEDFEAYIGDLLDEVITMTPDETEILVTLAGVWGVAAFYPRLEESDPATYRLFVDHVLAIQDLSAEAATDRDIRTVDVSLAFHGPDPYQPAHEDYLLPDRAHPSAEGSRVVAELLLAASAAATSVG